MPDDGEGHRPFRVGLRRGVLEALRLRGAHQQQGSALLLQAIGALEDMHDTGPALTHQWVQEARTHEMPWSAIAGALGIAKQTAHERFARPAMKADSQLSDALWASVQVARDRHADMVDGEEQASEVSWRNWWGAKPPRDLVDLTTLHQVLTHAHEELALLVAEARLQGVTWNKIGDVLGGVSRQGAHKRFSSAVAAILVACERGPEN